MFLDFPRSVGIMRCLWHTALKIVLSQSVWVSVCVPVAIYVSVVIVYSIASVTFVVGPPNNY